MPRALLSSASGCIGSHIFKKSNRTNFEVFGLDVEGESQKAIIRVEVCDPVALLEMVRSSL